jgi:hypothetical protein
MRTQFENGHVKLTSAKAKDNVSLRRDSKGNPLFTSTTQSSSYHNCLIINEGRIVSSKAFVRSIKFGKGWTRDNNGKRVEVAQLGTRHDVFYVI